MRSVALRDAWRTLVPESGSRDGPLPPLLVGLTVVTGLVDAFSYLGLGHVFVANMTGNVIFVAFSIAGAPGFSIWASVLAVAAFSVGAASGGRLAKRHNAHRGTLLGMTVVTEAVLVLGATVVGALVGHPFGAGARAVLIVVLGIAMGAQNAAARRLAVPDLTTTVLTMTLTGISADSRLAGGEDGKLGRRVLSVLSMFIGALIGAGFERHGNRVASLVVATGLLAAVGVVAAVRSRTPGVWSAPR